MRRLFPNNLLSNVRGDLFGGLTAAIVALPLALAFGVASGAGPLAGLYGAIALGFFAALFGGTPAQVSGPTGPMTIVMTAVIAQYQHDPALVFTVVFLGGLLQMLFGMGGIGRYIVYVPYPVISGFMTGIGLIIILMQSCVLLGHAPADNSIHTLTHLPAYLTDLSPEALATGLVALAILLLIPHRLRAHFPPPLIALIVCTLMGLYVLQGVETLGDVPMGLPALQVPHFAPEHLPGILASALTLAMLGSIDSLLTSLVADNFTRTQHRSDRELIGQGIGNMVAGLVGGLPGAGATMRTVINIRSGGRTPLSGMTHALVLLAFLVGLGFIVEDIPKAALAGILLKVGWDIIDWPFLRRLRRAGIKCADRQATIVMLTVLVLTVFVDLITAVAAGIIMESLITARRLATHQIDDVQFATAGGRQGVRHGLSEEEEDLIEETNGRLLLLRFTGPLSFGTARDLSARLQGVYDSYDAVVLDLTDARMMDISIMLTLGDMVSTMVKSGKSLFISGTGNAVYQTMQDHGIFAGIQDENLMQRRKDALQKAASSLQETENKTA